MIHLDPPLSPSWQRALDQAREIRRRRSRDSALAAERLWFEMVKEAMAAVDKSAGHAPPASRPGAGGV